MNKEGQKYAYEIFICRAFNYDDRTDVNGADAGIFGALVASEQNTPIRINKDEKHIYLFEKVKGHIDNAIDEFLKKRNLLEEERKILNNMKTLSYSAQNSDDLYLIINLAEPIINRLTV